MKKNKYKIKKWVLAPIFILMCSLILCFGFVKPTTAYSVGVSESDVITNYSTFAPNNLKIFTNDVVNGTTDYLYLDIDLSRYSYLSYDVDTFYYEPKYYLQDNVFLNGMLRYTMQAHNQVFYDYINWACNGIDVGTDINVDSYFVFSWDNLVLPSINGIIANMASAYDDFFSGVNYILAINSGSFTYMTCNLYYWTYSSDGYAILNTLPIEFNFSDSDLVHSLDVLYYINIYELFNELENIYSSSYNLGQYFVACSDLHIYGSFPYLFYGTAFANLAYTAPYIPYDNIPFYDSTDMTAYHSYYFTLKDYFSNPNIPPLAYTPIEQVDMASWLVRSVGAFMNAELFPGFFIGGILAVMVAFPLAIWFLKIVLGGQYV